MAKDGTSPTRKSAADAAAAERVGIGAGSVHDSFLRQVQSLIAKADISEQDRQRILANMSCPCCCGFIPAITVKLVDGSSSGD